MFNSPYSRIIAVAGLSLLAATASAQRIYCYDDANGRRVCGDSLPPEAARFDREVRNDQGVVIGRERGEISAEEQRALEQERRLEAERQREADERRRYGQLLLDSYSSVQDIEALRDRMLNQISGQITLYETQLAGFEDKLNSLMGRAQRFAPYSDAEDARPLPENLELDIERTESSISLFRERLEESRREQVETRENFERDISYFKELKGEDA